MGNYNTKNREKKIDVKLTSNTKRPKQIEEKLITTNPKNTINHLIALSSLSKLGCDWRTNKMKHLPTKGELNKFLEVSDWIKFSTQNTLACLVKKILKDFDKDSEKIAFGDKSLQKVFYPIRELSSGANGVTMVTGYKGSEPFAIIKSTGSNEPLFYYENNLHEIAVGLLLNTLRKEIPNFMYLYGGFYCAPPLLLQKVFGEWKERENIQEKIREAYRMPTDFYKLEDDDYDLPDNEKNPLFKSFKDKMLDLQDTVQEKYRKEEITTKEYMQARTNLLESLIDEWKVSGRPETRAEQLVMETILKLKSIDPNEIESLKEKIKEEPKLEFDPSHLCMSEEDKTTLVLYEYVKDSTSLRDFMFDKDVQKEDKIKVMNQIILAYMMAYNKYKFVHHDLHTGNVLVRKLKDEMKCTYKNSKGEKVTIFSRYIPVIIDMGMVSMEWNGLKLETLNEELSDFDKSNQDSIRSDFGFIYGDIFGDFFDMQKEAGIEIEVVDLGEEYKNLLKSISDKDVNIWFEEIFQNSKNN